MSSNELPKELIEQLKRSIDALDKKFEILTDRIDNVEKTQQVIILTRQPMSYSTYLKVKGLREAGFNQAEICRELNIPYSTIRRYLSWTEKQIATAAAKEAKQKEAASKPKVVKRVAANENEADATRNSYYRGPHTLKKS